MALIPQHMRPMGGIDYQGRVAATRLPILSTLCARQPHQSGCRWISCSCRCHDKSDE